MPFLLDGSVPQNEFQQSIPYDVVAPLRSHIAGGHAELHRYDVSAEKAETELGDYNPSSDEVYDWPGRSANTVLDAASPRLFIDDALLRYYTNAASSGDTVTPVANTKNQVIVAGATGFKTNGSSYPRLAALKDRDVTVGDVVTLVDGVNNMTTYVAGLIGDAVGASVGSPVAGSGNLPTQPSNFPGSAPGTSVGGSGGALAANTYFVRFSYVGPFGETWASAASSFTIASLGEVCTLTIPALPSGATSANIYLSPPGGTALQCTRYKTGVTTTSVPLTTVYATGGPAYPATATQTSGTSNAVSVTAVTDSSYKGTATGDIVETYTATVTQASTGGDATTARLQVSSASGRDDQSSVTPAAFASPTSIGTRGATATWGNGGSADFVVGQTWQFTVRQAWTIPTVAAAGTFTGSSDITYLVQVTLGGLFADATKPQITVTTTNGLDGNASPITVTTSAAAVPIGTLGVTFTPTGSGLRKNDLYVIAVAGPTVGAYRTILLGNNLTTALQSSTDMTMYLAIRKNIEVPAQRVSAPPNLNWSADDDAITVESGIDAYDPTLTDGGVQFAVPVVGGTLFVEYRAWLPTFAGKVTEVSTEAEAVTLFGESQLSPDNPLGYAVWRAVKASNVTPVRFTALADPDDMDEWTEVLAQLEGIQDVTGLTPLTRNTDVWDKYIAHIAARYDRGGEYRHAWFSPEAVSEQTILSQANSSDEEVILATLADDPATSGTQYTYLTVTSGNADFVTNGVLPGDIARFLYTVNSFGEVTYSSFTVEAVVNEDTLRFRTGYSGAVSTPQRVEIHRNLKRTQIAAALAEIPTAAPNKQVRYVWPDSIIDEDGLEVPGYILAAVYAAFVSGIAPQQGVRELVIPGFSSAPRSTTFFNNAQLNVLGEAGFFVVTSQTGRVYAKYARTSDVSTLDNREESLVRLDDASRYLFHAAVAQFFGKVNTSNDSLAAVRNGLETAKNHAKNDTLITRIGPMLIDAEVEDVRPSVVEPDRVTVAVTTQRGNPLNNATISLTVAGATTTTTTT